MRDNINDALQVENRVSLTDSTLQLRRHLSS